MFHNIAIRSGSDNGRGDFAETLREVDWIVGLLVDELAQCASKRQSSNNPGGVGRPSKSVKPSTGSTATGCGSCAVSPNN